MKKYFKNTCQNIWIVPSRDVYSFSQSQLRNFKNLSICNIMTTARDIFKRVLELSSPNGEPINYPTFSIYMISHYTDPKIVFRVDCGEVGSYEIIKITEEETYNPRIHQWVTVPCEHYMFSCMSQNHNGYPLINPDMAIKILNSFPSS